MLNALMLLKKNYRFDIEIIDIDTEHKWHAQYDELVPLLTVSAGTSEHVYLCHYHFDSAVVIGFLDLQDA